MPLYEIKQYELHAMNYRVEADSPAQAIVKLFDGDGEAVDDSLEYVEVADECGLAADDHLELAEGLRSLGLPIEHLIPSIRSISRSDGSGLQPTEQTGEIEWPNSQ